MLLKITTRDLVLMSLLGGSAALAMLTTIFFHAMIPIPGFGGIVAIPLGAACLIIARDRIAHPLAAGLTKTMQHMVLFFLPAGPPWVHIPWMIPFLVVAGFLIDGLASFSKKKLSETSWWWCGLISLLAGGVGVLIQAGTTAFLIEKVSTYTRQGVLGLIVIFLGLHSLLRFLGGAIGWVVISSIPNKQT